MQLAACNDWAERMSHVLASRDHWTQCEGYSYDNKENDFHTTHSKEFFSENSMEVYEVFVFQWLFLRGKSDLNSDFTMPVKLTLTFDLPSFVKIGRTTEE